MSLVREASEDVAADAVYRFKNKSTQVYYAKNNLSPSDEAHAREFADWVRLAVSGKTSVKALLT